MGRLRRVELRVRASFRDAAAAGAASILAWVLAQHLFGHQSPVFAAVTAMVCLAPGLPSHRGQATGLVVGVATGIAVGEVLLWLLPDTLPLMRLGLCAFSAILIAAAWGLAPVVAIQSGVSALLVLSLGPVTAGPVRMLDVMTGAAVGLFFSQVLITPDPIRKMDVAARELLQALGAALTTAAAGLRAADPEQAGRALQALSAAHRSITQLDSGILAARDAARWSLRGRFASREVARIARRHDRHAIRVYASALLLGEALVTALRRDKAVPEGLADQVARAAATCLALTRGEEVSSRPAAPDAEHLPPPWRACFGRALLLDEALADFSGQSPEGEKPAVAAHPAPPSS